MKKRKRKKKKRKKKEEPRKVRNFVWNLLSFVWILDFGKDLYGFLWMIGCSISRV